MEDQITNGEVAIAIVAMIGVFVATTVIVTVIVWQIFATSRARMSVAREEGYRKLAEQSAEAIQRVTAQLDRQATQVADIHTRTAELERLLKEVE
jgi:hypothetical protein